LAINKKLNKMDEQLKMLNERIDKLQSTLDWMIERMWRAQSLRSLEPIKENNAGSTEGFSFIGGGTSGSIPGSDN
jgi:hypothetical protein